MIGIGKKTQPKLFELGIETIGDIANYHNYEKIKPIFGKNTLIFYQRANGKDFSKINYSKNELKSVGNSTTFESDSNDEQFIRKKFKELSQEVSKRAKKRGLISNSISITLKYSREKSRTKQMIIENYTNEEEIIYGTSLLLFENIYHGELLRLVGVSLNNVIHYKDLNQQISLFDYSDNNDIVQKNMTDQIIDTLNSSFESIQLVKASSLIHEEEIKKKYLKNNE